MTAAGQNGATWWGHRLHATKIETGRHQTAPNPLQYLKERIMRFVSAHVIACMTRQDVTRLLKRFQEEANDDVRNVRILCDTLSGRMVCEWDARDRLTLIEWLKKCNVQLRGTGEWVMSVQYESVGDTLVSPTRSNN